MQIYVNLAVKDLAASKGFFTGLGFSFNPDFADENMDCLVISDTSSVMLHVEPYFQTFTKKAIADATTTTEAILALGVDSRQQVDELVDRALATGGQPSKDPVDLGFVYTRSFQDLDGHIWEATYVDASAVPPQA